MNEIEQVILGTLSSEKGTISARLISEKTKIKYDSVMSILSKLSEEAKLELLKSENTYAQLTPEGLAYSKNLLPERQLANSLKKGPIEFSQLSAHAKLSPTETQIALQWARKNGWIEIKKENGKTMVFLLKDPSQTSEEKLITKLSQGRQVFEKTPEFETLKARSLIAFSTEKEFGAKITKKGREQIESGSDAAITQLTPQMLKSGDWKDVKFREYDLSTMMVENSHAFGKKHFYLEYIRNLKEQLASLGFMESSGPFTEMEFWNMDSLFMPQDHPARQIHDVFSLDLPEGKLPDKKLVSGVRQAHERGVDGSIGWGYSWNEKMASRIELRSQTTSVSARLIASGLTPPVKMFCVGKVFRPDEIDWKHFLEFNQCEGIVADENMNFRELLGYLHSFAVDIFGANKSDVKFAPSFFPFTEPSVEMMVRINGKWTEVGGAGIFRPEMTKPLGCNVPVLAWGLGLDRLAMIKLHLSDIRELHSMDIGFLRSK